MTALEAVRNEITRLNFPYPPKYISSNSFTSFPALNKGPKNTSARAKLFPDGKGGIIFDHTRNFKHIVFVDDPLNSSRSSHIDSKPTMPVVMAEDHHEDAVNYASNKWYDAQPAKPHHPYLLSKNITSGSLAKQQRNNDLILPVTRYTADGLEFTSIQTIKPDGSKRLLKGGKKKGCFIPCNQYLTRSPDHVIVCEGFSTGRSICEAAHNYYFKHLGIRRGNHAVVAAIDAGNLLPVIKHLMLNLPNAQFLIVGDDDRANKINTGRDKATTAAQSTGAGLWFPPLTHLPNTCSDFNDFWSAEK